MEPPGIETVIFVLYLDHVLYNRASALAMKPQTRAAVGWLIYECEQYIILTWDRDIDPPTIKGGDPKASGLVLLKSDILELIRIKLSVEPPKENSEWVLNSPNADKERRVRASVKEAKNSKKRSNKDE